MADRSDFLSKGEVESSVQSTDQQQPDSHELPSLDHQSSLYSLTFDDFQYTFSDGTRSFGSMNMDEFLSNIWTAEEVQAHAQTPVTNSSTALCTVATTAAATININPQFPEGEINTPTENDINIQQSLLRQGSVMLPEPLSQKTVDEVWSERTEIHKFQQELEHVSTGCTANVQKAGSPHGQTTYGDMTLEDFLVTAGVVRGQGHPPSAPLKQPCESYQNNDKTALGSGPPGHVASPVIALEGAENVPPYPAPPHSSVRDAASEAVGGIPNRYQPREVCNGGRTQNRASGDRYGQQQRQWTPPASPISSDGVGADQDNSVNQTGMNVNGSHRRNALVDRVVLRRQKRKIKNRESAARSRARKQAYTQELEAELKYLKAEHARLTQAVEEKERREQDLMQYIEEKMNAQKAKDRKIGMRRSWSWPY